MRKLWEAKLKSVQRQGLIMLAVLGTACLPGRPAWGQAMIVRDGQPAAVIVIDENSARMAKLAADELRDYILKISGAELPLRHAPDADYPVTIYVGRSLHTDKLDITADGLEYGAFRMVSGPDYLVLLGDDFDFEPPEPWARNNGDRPRAQAEWDKISGGTWINPMNSVFRSYHRASGTWFHDRGGSFSAVCEFLRTLGVRWYMPGELGEVVPQMASIPLPALDRSVHPDHAMRRWFGAYFAFCPDTWAWDRRLGMNSGYEVHGAGMHVHGMRLIQGHEEMQAAHPEYFAIYGGKRDTDFRGTGHACFTSEGLEQEAVRFARAVFDVFDEPAVSLWPQDGFRQCQCEKCWPMTPSDNVWIFIDRVAREVYKTHPDRMISGGAYGSYRLPPEGIEKFSPNVLVFLAHHRPGLDTDEYWANYTALVEGWLAKTGPGRLIHNCNNYFNLVSHPRSFDRDLKFTRGKALGDWNEVRRKSPGRGQPVEWQTPGIDHINQYVNARLLWDAGLDLEALLDEYYTLFYGPARAAMRAAWEYAEANYTRAGRARFELPHRIKFAEMLAAARNLAGDTIYGERISLIMDEVGAIDDLRRELEEDMQARLREDAPLALGHAGADTAGLPVYQLRDLASGEDVDIRTDFTVRWDDNAIVFDIRCHEPDMANLFVSKDIWGGDSVAILLETAAHCYYQLEINPDGDLFDADREHGRVQAQWSSHAGIATERGADFWRVEVRIPVVDETEGVLDPLNFVVGAPPAPDAPWFFNIGRVRIRDGQKDAYGFSPTGHTYHNIRKFGRLEIR